MESYTLERAVDWIHGARYQGQKNGLENTRALLKELGNPQESLKMVHVAGTNGKGSVCSMIERVLRECGYKTGLYTSPYLCEYAERVRIDGVPMEDEALLAVILRVKDAAERLVERGICPTAFELGTAIAFLAFKEAGVDYAVIEVGIGGRLDSTNVITPCACAIAAIGIDHTKTLGNTIEEIASEKAGIIKPGIPVAIHPANGRVMHVFENAAAERGAHLDRVEMPEILSENARGAAFCFRGEEYSIGLPGRYQIENAALAIATLKLLGITDQKALHAGIEKAKWHCRLEWVKGVLIDGAHNPQGAQMLAEFLEKHVSGKRTLVVGMMHDKDISECVPHFSRVADRVIATQIDDPRAANAQELAEMFVNAEAVPNVKAAIETALADDSTVIVCGSLYLAGEARAILCPGERLSL